MAKVRSFFRFWMTIPLGAIISGGLTWSIWRFYQSNGGPQWLLCFLSPLILITTLFVLVFLAFLIVLPIGLILWIKRQLVLRYGIETITTVIEVRARDWDGDTILEGKCIFYDSHGRKHLAKFKFQFHWLTPEEGTLVQQGYSLGAKNPLHYLRWLPAIHEIEFPI